MEGKSYRLQAAPGLSVAPESVDALLSLGDGDCALLYLYLLRRGGETTDAAARELRRSPEDIARAAEKLRAAGLLGEEERSLPPAEELPEYEAAEIVGRSMEDGAFKALLAEAQARLGHTLSRADLQTLFGIYDRLGLPCEVIMLLINRCAEVARRRYGEGRLPTMHAVEKEAYVWCNREIMTLERAEEYLAELEKREEDMARLQQLLQLDDRAPTPTVRGYMESWLSMGFPWETLALAYDRTMTGTGKLAWKYMDTILRSWREKGLRTPAEIEKGDRRGAPSRRSGKAASTPAAWEGDDLDRLERMLDKQMKDKNKRG